MYAIIEASGKQYKVEEGRYVDFELLGKKVYLETYVKTLKNWRDEEKYFLELGLKEEDE